MTLLFSYKDADVYDRDRDLFLSNNWLNDSCINYCFRRQDDLISLNILLLDPSVASFLRFQCTDDEDFLDLCHGLSMDSREWVFIPITDNQSIETSSTHWSIILCHCRSKKLWHYDSLRKNDQVASGFSHKLSKLFLNQKSFDKINSTNRSEEMIVQKLFGPMQNNGHDCGVMVILFVKYMCNLITTTVNVEERIQFFCDEGLAEFMEPAKRTSFRMEKYIEISSMSSIQL